MEHTKILQARMSPRPKQNRVKLFSLSGQYLTCHSHVSGNLFLDPRFREDDTRNTLRKRKFLSLFHCCGCSSGYWHCG